ncbi:hypothetical protein D9M71_635520 [compost metagenome]
MVREISKVRGWAMLPAPENSLVCAGLMGTVKFWPPGPPLMVQVVPEILPVNSICPSVAWAWRLIPASSGKDSAKPKVRLFICFPARLIKVVR